MDFISNMYGGSPYSSKEYTKQVPDDKPVDTKKISRIIGGMKAQGVTSKTVDIDGELFEIPKMDYIKILEKQISEMRTELRQAQTRIARLSDNLNLARMSIKSLEDENRKNPVRFRNVKNIRKNQ